jgi:opacity protein-like surface antigen
MSTVTRFYRAVLSNRTALAIALFIVALPAHAADLTKAPPAPAVAYSWTGAYVGVNFGGAWDREDVTSPFGLAATNPGGVLGGAQLGYNYQFSSWLLGIEAEFDGTDAQGSTNFVGPATGGPGTGTALAVFGDHRWYTTVSGRLGYVMGSLLLYVKAGGAWMNADYKLGATTSGITVNDSLANTRSGWNAGIGLEYPLFPRWSAKLEYDYLDFGTSTLNFVDAGIPASFKTQVNEIKLGLNYHFGY